MQHNVEDAGQDTWRGFGCGQWRTATDVAGFIRDNVTTYEFPVHPRV